MLMEIFVSLTASSSSLNRFADRSNGDNLNLFIYCSCCFYNISSTKKTLRKSLLSRIWTCFVSMSTILWNNMYMRWQNITISRITGSSKNKIALTFFSDFSAGAPTSVTSHTRSTWVNLQFVVRLRPKKAASLIIDLNRWFSSVYNLILKSVKLCLTTKSVISVICPSKVLDSWSR